MDRRERLALSGLATLGYRGAVTLHDFGADYLRRVATPVRVVACKRFSAARTQHRQAKQCQTRRHGVAHAFFPKGKSRPQGVWGLAAWR